MATATIYADISDNVVNSNNTVLATAQDGSALTLNTVTDLECSAQQYDGGDGAFYCSESFLAFDSTGILAAGDTVTAATFSFKKKTATDTPGTVEIRLFDWGAAVNTTDWRSRAQLGALTLLADGNPHSTAVDSFFAFTDVAGPSNIVKNGVTRIVMNLADHRLGNTPPASPTVPSFKFYSADNTGTSSDPKLEVTYTPLVNVSRPLLSAQQQAVARASRW